MAVKRALRYGVYALASLLGAAAFVAPLLRPPEGSAARADAPLLLTALLGLAFLALLLEAQSGAGEARMMALLGALVAVNAGLRFVENVIPGPGGFSPIFFLILVSGYVFGARPGFLMGALTMFVSALLTGGVGPWLPAQMLAAGWVGMSAPLARPLTAGRPRLALAWLTGLGIVWGFVYGALLNLWFWPYAVGAPGQSWQAGLGAAEAWRRYAAFYLATSLGWDALRAAGTAALMVVLGPATLRVLSRFRARTLFVHVGSTQEM